MTSATRTDNAGAPSRAPHGRARQRHKVLLAVALVAAVASCNRSRSAQTADSASAVRTANTGNGALAADVVPLSSPRFDSVDALARTGALTVRHFVLREPSDSASPLTTADTTEYAAPITGFVFITDSAGTLHRVDYEPATASGDWTGTFSFLLDSAGHVAAARLDVITLATDCDSPIRVLEEWIPATSSRRRYVLDQDDQPLADLSCGASVAPIDSTATNVDRLREKMILPANWRALVRPESAKARD